MAKATGTAKVVEFPMERVGGQSTMNPNTLLRLWAAFEGHDVRKYVHILEIGAYSGCWPGTVYRAMQLGYLQRGRPAWFKTTRKMRDEIARVERMRG